MENWFTPSTILALVAIGLTAFKAYYDRQRDKRTDWKQDFDELDQKLDQVSRDITEIQGNVKVLDKQVNLFWKTVEQQMAKKFKDD